LFHLRSFCPIFAPFANEQFVPNPPGCLGCQRWADLSPELPKIHSSLVQAARVNDGS
jgi:hypothetical protein